MARGWESKAVEEQISAAEDKQHARSKAESSAVERKAQRRREALLLDRVRITRELESSRNPRYRALLEQSLAHVEAELKKSEPADSVTES